MMKTKDRQNRKKKSNDNCMQFQCMQRTKKQTQKAEKLLKCFIALEKCAFFFLDSTPIDGIRLFVL